LARVDDVLQIRLLHPPRRELQLIGELNHRFAAAHRCEHGLHVRDNADVLVNACRPRDPSKSCKARTKAGITFLPDDGKAGVGVRCRIKG
jgi:hypothetical protein